MLLCDYYISLRLLCQARIFIFLLQSDICYAIICLGGMK
nr:MAG TPA: hypothetical protein [Caudoviricetes sp.]